MSTVPISGSGYDDRINAPPDEEDQVMPAFYKKISVQCPIIQKYGDSRFKKREPKPETQFTFLGDVNYVMVLHPNRAITIKLKRSESNTGLLAASWCGEKCTRQRTSTDDPQSKRFMVLLRMVLLAVSGGSVCVEDTYTLPHSTAFARLSWSQISDCYLRHGWLGLGWIRVGSGTMG
ncbi:hypothetical protein FN846DRAFT_889766 [Sphaerosporella brunnea]|uniref:Uncharacterized protein n=1 Tax=Sphaerosporella brunnea TaxID=1250544 RepID=A0A5J5EYW5_9PEZI|nr:hypothetical protein FN846DRAFT_889766 [Sphaerosporella brunnea]